MLPDPVPLKSAARRGGAAETPMMPPESLIPWASLIPVVGRVTEIAQIDIVRASPAEKRGVISSVVGREGTANNLTGTVDSFRGAAEASAERAEICDDIGLTSRDRSCVLIAHCECVWLPAESKSGRHGKGNENETGT